jgi:hypothetical protein
MSEMITGGSTVAVPNHKVTKPTHYLSLVRLWLICISTILVVEDNKEIGRWIDNTACSTKERRKGVREGDHGINNQYGRLERMTGSRLRSSAFLSDFISWRASAAST